MKKLLYSIVVSFLCIPLRAQVIDDFQKYMMEQNEAINKYIRDEEEAIRRYNDSINMAFGKYLAENWPEYKLEKHDQSIKNPVPLTYFDPQRQPSSPVKLLPNKEFKIPQIPIPPIKKEEKLPIIPLDNFKTSLFYGATISYPKLSLPLLKLKGVTEKDVADYWNQLSALSYPIWTTRIEQLREELMLNDWALYLLVKNSFHVYFPQGNSNEEVIYTIFTLNQLGYRARIGRDNKELMPLLAVNCNINGSMYFYDLDNESVKYWVMDPENKELDCINSCRMEYGNADRLFDMGIKYSLQLPVSLVTKSYVAGDEMYELSYNQNLQGIYSTYPCIDYPIYAQSALDDVLVESINETLCPVLQGLSQEEAVNKLLRFVQLAFEYKTDNEQFGVLERRFFAEETMSAQYSDCEDRAILFAQLVRHLLDMPIVLVHYLNRHLATAIHFDNPDTFGDYLMIDDKKYLICDPTYINANLGRSMPQLNDVPIIIYKLK